MAAPRRLLLPAQALARVLVQPSLNPARFNVAAKLQTPIALPVTQFRTAARTSLAKKNDKEPRARRFVVDEQIGSLYINLVQEDGTFVPQQRLRDVLKDMDRIDNVLIQVAPPQSDHEHPYPICRIITKEELREIEKEKIKKKKTLEDLTKVVEITWSIAKHDLDTQMKRLVQFLEQGLRVEISLGPKKRGRTATPEEIDAVFNRVKETATSVPGVKPYAQPEGELGRVFSMYYSKPKQLLADEQAKQKEEAEAAAAAAAAQKALEEETSQKPKKVSKYRIKEERRRQGEVEAQQQARYPEPRAAFAIPRQRDWSMPRPESAYEREQRRMREERQRESVYASQAQSPAMQVRRRQGSDLGGRTGSLLSGFRADES
ncbi:hypothetical protein IWX49DRAFT_586566 [Phyllosticta citricarpa]|uniref:Translation initiation factor IF-3 n=2 Tax=Phyllosticta TaxID=121621 RepID=A0ABR1L396_9PEZI